MDQSVDLVKKVVLIKMVPDKRYHPVCHRCERKVKKIHSYHQRTIRDLNLFDARTFITISYRTLRCPSCGDVVEKMEMVDLYQRITRRLAHYILELCQFITLREVARHLRLDWKTIKEIHKGFLKERFSGKTMGYPKILAIDEISLRKGHHYLTVILNWENGRVLWVGEGRKYETLKAFFDSLSQEQKDSIEAVAIDIWDLYIKAIKECCPRASIVFDQFHGVRAFGKVIDQVRNAEYRKANREGKEVIKGSKCLLLKNRENLRKEEKPKLRSLLELIQALTSVYILSD